ncbi:MAG: VanZ family protein [Prochlorotrichaceae cyanobacterium]|jgi:VanZ family protein
MKKIFDPFSIPKPLLLRGVALGFAGLLVTIVVAANQSRLPAPLQFLANLPFGDTLGHFCLMGILAFLCNLAWPVTHWQWKNSRILQISKASLIILTIVTLEEISQFFFPARTPSLIDLGADYVGIFLLGNLGHYWGKQLQDFS